MGYIQHEGWCKMCFSPDILFLPTNPNIKKYFHRRKFCVRPYWERFKRVWGDFIHAPTVNIWGPFDRWCQKKAKLTCLWLLLRRGKLKRKYCTIHVCFFNFGNQWIGVEITSLTALQPLVHIYFATLWYKFVRKCCKIIPNNLYIFFHVIFPILSSLKS